MNEERYISLKIGALEARILAFETIKERHIEGGLIHLWNRDHAEFRRLNELDVAELDYWRLQLKGQSNG